MPQIRFASTAPAIAQFSAQAARDDNERRMQEQDFQRRFQLERQVEADRGIRDVFGNAIANRTAQPPMPAAAAPSPAQAAPPIGQFSAPQTTAPASIPPPTAPGLITTPAQDMGAGAPLPAGAVPAPAPGQIAAPAPSQPLPSAAPAAAAAVRPVAGRGQSDEIMAGLAKVPGAAGTLMSMYNTDQAASRAGAQQERQMQLQALKEFGDAAQKGQLNIAKAINQRFGLGIPDQLIDNPGFISKMGGFVGALKEKLPPEQLFAATEAYLGAIARGADDNTAVMEGLRAGKGVKPAFKATYHTTGPNGEIIGVSPDMETRTAPGVRARVPATGAGARGGAGGNSVYNQKYQAYLKVHPGDDAGALEYASGRRQPSAADIKKWSITAAQSDLRTGRINRQQFEATRKAYEDGFNARPVNPASGQQNADPLGLRTR